jgi:hypothetical protein
MVTRLGWSLVDGMRMHGFNVSRIRRYDITSANVPNNPNNPIPRHSKIIVFVRHIKLLPSVAACRVSFACVRSFIIYYLVYDLYRLTLLSSEPCGSGQITHTSLIHLLHH